MKDKLKEHGFIIGIIAIVIIGAFFYFFNQTTDHQDDNTVYDNYETKTEEKTYMYIDIKGQIDNPGVYKVESDTRLYQLIYKAGGLTGLADEAAINLSLILIDQNVIYIPSYEDEFPALGLIIEEPITSGVTELININTATQEQLMILPGIGESTANTIIDYRTTNGLFETTENIVDVPGIGEATYENIKTRITV